MTANKLRARRAGTDSRSSCRHSTMSLAAREAPNACASSRRRWNPPILNERAGARVLLKAETLQRTGSFKFRGAHNLHQPDLPGDLARRRRRLLVGQSRPGVAEAARLAGLRATIVMPRDAPGAEDRADTRRGRGGGPVSTATRRPRGDRLQAVRRARSAVRPALRPPRHHRRAGHGGLELLRTGADSRRAADSGAGPAAAAAWSRRGAWRSSISRPAARYTAWSRRVSMTLRARCASGQRERNARLSGSICDALLSASRARSPSRSTAAVLGRSRVTR